MGNLTKKKAEPTPEQEKALKAFVQDLRARFAKLKEPDEDERQIINHVPREPSRDA